jgi:hypothetical protein
MDYLSSSTNSEKDLQVGWIHLSTLDSKSITRLEPRIEEKTLVDVKRVGKMVRMNDVEDPLFCARD